MILGLLKTSAKVSSVQFPPLLVLIILIEQQRILMLQLQKIYFSGVNTAYTNEGNFTKPMRKNQYTTFAPSLTWNVSDKLQLNVDYELFNNRVTASKSLLFLSFKQVL